MWKMEISAEVADSLWHTQLNLKCHEYNEKKYHHKEGSEQQYMDERIAD